METQFRTYNPGWPLAGDYDKVRDFLLKVADPHFSFARWDWMITHSYLDDTLPPQIGLWKHEGAIVAMSTSDILPTGGYVIALPGFEVLYPALLEYAHRFTAKGPPRVCIPNMDAAMQAAAAALGCRPTPETEDDAVFELAETSTVYALPQGYTLASMADRYDLYQYGRAMYYGFDHADEGPYAPAEEELEGYRREFERPHVDLNLKIVAVAPDGDFVAYCGMWFDAESGFAIVEPVATHPAHRRKGLGRAVVLEGVRRCGALGAKRAFVGSNQRFYYSIGFRPRQTASWWVKA